MPTKIDLSTCSLTVNSKSVLITEENSTHLFLGALAAIAFPEDQPREGHPPLDSIYSAFFYTNRTVKVYNPWWGEWSGVSGELPKGSRFVFLEDGTILTVEVYRKPTASRLLSCEVKEDKSDIDEGTVAQIVAYLRTEVECHRPNKKCAISGCNIYSDHHEIEHADSDGYASTTCNDVAAALEKKYLVSLLKQGAS